jgi:hypothetical protein
MYLYLERQNRYVIKMAKSTEKHSRKTSVSAIKIRDYDKEVKPGLLHGLEEIGKKHASCGVLISMQEEQYKKLKANTEQRLTDANRHIKAESILISFDPKENLMLIGFNDYPKKHHTTTISVLTSIGDGVKEQLESMAKGMLRTEGGEVADRKDVATEQDGRVKKSEVIAALLQLRDDRIGIKLDEIVTRLERKSNMKFYREAFMKCRTARDADGLIKMFATSSAEYLE